MKMILTLCTPNHIRQAAISEVMKSAFTAICIRPTRQIGQAAISKVVKSAFTVVICIRPNPQIRQAAISKVVKSAFTAICIRPTRQIMERRSGLYSLFSNINK